MEILFFLFAMAALWLFINRDGRALKKKLSEPLNRSNFKNGYKPAHSPRWPGYAAVSVLCFAFAASSYYKPLAPPFTGRLSSLRQFLYSHVGEYGESLAFLGAMVVFGGLAVLAYLQALQQRRKQNAA